MVGYTDVQKISLKTENEDVMLLAKVRSTKSFGLPGRDYPCSLQYSTRMRHLERVVWHLEAEICLFEVQHLTFKEQCSFFHSLGNSHETSVMQLKTLHQYRYKVESDITWYT